MKTEILDPVKPDTLSRLLEVIQNGGLVALPTDTVYGIGSTAFDDEAIKSIYRVKKRPHEKSIPVLIADLGDLQKIVKLITPLAAKLANHFWPGPITLVLPKRNGLPESISATSTVGVRLPNHNIARSLFRLAGPMAITSANISGQVSARSADEVYQQLKGRVPLIIDGGETPGGIPSTVVDVTGDEPKIIREGPISLDEIKSIL